MKYVVAILSLVLLFSTTATADGLQIKNTEVNGNTVITCHVPSEKGKIEMAFIRFNSINEKTLPGKKCVMEITDDNVATFTAPGTYQVLEGKVKILMADLSQEIIREDFIIKK